MKDRLVFLHFIFINSEIDRVSEVRILNQEYETTRLIGSTPMERKMTLTNIYRKMANKLPKESSPEKKHSTFSATII